VFLFNIMILYLLAASSACAPVNNEASTPIPPTVEREITTLSCFIAHQWFPVNEFTGVIPEQITQDTGVKLDLIIAVDSQQLSILIASGDLPDLVYTDTSLDKLSNPDLCYAYDDLIENYHIDWSIDTFARENALLFSPDDKVYFVFNHDPGKDSWVKTDFGVPMAPSLSLRKDLLEEMGNPELKTLDDLSNVFEEVKYRYPDLIPLIFDPSWRFNVFRVWSGVTQQDWISQEDGSYQFYTQTAAYKEMLWLLNSYYRKGYLVADNFAESDSQSSHWYELGRAFSKTTCTQNANVGYTNRLKGINPNFSSIECPPLDHSDYVTSDIGWSGTFITKNCTSPESAIRFMQYLFTPYAQKLTQMGREGIDYTLEPSTGRPLFSTEWMASIEQGTHNDIYNSWFYFGGSEIIESISRCASLPNYENDYKSTYDSIRAGYRNEPWLAAAIQVRNSEEKTMLDKVYEMIIPYEAKMILSDSDQQFEAGFMKFQNSLNQVGLQELTQFMVSRIKVMREQYE